MYLQDLSLKNFRIFSDFNISFNNRTNIISGPNGQGKTSIIEAIYYLALTRSFRSLKDTNVINHEYTYFNIDGKIIFDKNKIKKIFLSHEKNGKKQLFVNDKKVTKFSEFIGNLPCVLLTLDDLKLTMGYPSARRKFLDILLSQISKIYLQNLKIYKRTIQQKNKLLNEESKETIEKQIDIWNEQISEYGSFIIKKRLEFIDFLNNNLSEYYHNFSKSNEIIEAEYKTNFDFENNSISSENLKINLNSKLRKVKNSEIDKRTILAGPHLDDLQFLKDKKSFKEYGSLGENKTLIIVLKILEWKYVSQNNKYKPMMLLDDIFGELDISRINGLLEFLKKTGQSFITTTLIDKFENHSDLNILNIEKLKLNYV